MSEKVDLIYDLVTQIDKRQRTKSEKDIIRHAKEDAKLSAIEVDLKNHKKVYDKDRVILYKLEEKRMFKSEVKKVIVKSVAITGSFAGLVYTIIRMVS